jgi:tetratricopeptide (TPR) repeat protein
MRSERLVLRLLVTLLLLGAGPGEVLAKATPADAEDYVRSEKLYERGRMFLDFGEVERAIRSLKAAWRTYHDEKYLLTLARAYDQKEDYENALRRYQEYLAFGVLASEREAVVARLEEIRTNSSFGKELVEVSVDPPDAQVFLDEANPFFRVQVPSKVFVPWGEHKWIVQKEDYRERVIPFTVERDKPEAYALKLDKLEFYVNATLQSNPPGAEVAVDGRAVGNTPVTVRVREGYYTVRMTYDDLPAFEKVIEFTRDQENVVQADLEKQRLDKGAVVAETAVGKDDPDVAKGDASGPDTDGDGTDEGRATTSAPDIDVASSAIYRVEEPTKAWMISGWSLVGTGLAGLVAGGVFTGLAFKDMADARGWADDHDSRTTNYHDKLKDLESRVNQKFLISEIAAGAGAALALTGAAFLLVDWLKPDAAPITVMPSVLPVGTGLSLRIDL